MKRSFLLLGIIVGVGISIGVATAGPATQTLPPVMEPTSGASSVVSALGDQNVYIKVDNAVSRADQREAWITYGNGQRVVLLLDHDAKVAKSQADNWVTSNSALYSGAKVVDIFPSLNEWKQITSVGQ